MKNMDEIYTPDEKIRKLINQQMYSLVLILAFSLYLFIKLVTYLPDGLNLSFSVIGDFIFILLFIFWGVYNYFSLSKKIKKLKNKYIKFNGDKVVIKINEKEEVLSEENMPAAIEVK